MQNAIGHVDFSFTSSLRPWDDDPEEYWIEVTGKIMVLPDDAPDEADPEPAGEIQMELVRVAEAENDNVSLCAVFDSTEALNQIYCALFDKREEVKADLDLEPFVHEVLYIHTLKLEPRYGNTSLGVQAIQTAASAFVTMGIVVADADLNLSLDDWKNLGFVRIAGERGFYVWEKIKENPYDRK